MNNSRKASQFPLFSQAHALKIFSFLMNGKPFWRSNLKLLLILGSVLLYFFFASASPRQYARAVIFVITLRCEDWWKKNIHFDFSLFSQLNANWEQSSFMCVCVTKFCYSIEKLCLFTFLCWCVLTKMGKICRKKVSDWHIPWIIDGVCRKYCSFLVGWRCDGVMGRSWWG